MIPFDFVYLRPESVDEAVSAYTECAKEGLVPYYYSGGTEIVTFARTGRVRPGAVIDVKRIPECRVVELDGEAVVFGAGVPLNSVVESDLFPMLSHCAGGVADHTVRNRLTLGGNIAGQLPYRETVLPLLLADAKLVLAGPNGQRTVAIGEVFSKRLLLEKAELLVQVRVGVAATQSRWKHVRREKGTRIDYPLVSVALDVWEGKLRLAASGLLAFPFRDEGVEECLNRGAASPQQRAEEALSRLPAAVRDDQRGSAEYRAHHFKKIIVEAIEELEKTR